MSAGALRWSLHSFSSPVGQEAPVTGRQTDPLLSSCMRCHIKCFLRRAWGLGLWVLLSTDLRGRNEPLDGANSSNSNKCTLFLQLAVATEASLALGDFLPSARGGNRSLSSQPPKCKPWLSHPLNSGTS